MKRDGFALMAVLWTVTLLAATVAVGAGGIRMGQQATANRLRLARGRWAAEACLAIAEARSLRGELTDSATIDLGGHVTCTWTVDYPDGRLDANTAAQATLARLAMARGFTPDSAEQFAQAVVARRNTRALTDVREVAGLHGADARILRLLAVDGSARVDAGVASPVVLASLPGLTPEAVDLILRRRERGEGLHSLDELAGALSPAARAVLFDDYRDLAPMIAFSSSRLVLMAHGWVGSERRPQATIEVVVERLPARLAVLRRRMR